MIHFDRSIKTSIDSIIAILIGYSCLLLSSCAPYSSIDADAVNAAEEEFQDDVFWGTAVDSAKVIYSSSTMSIVDIFVKGYPHSHRYDYIYVKTEDGAFGYSDSYYDKKYSTGFKVQEITNPDSLKNYLQHISNYTVTCGDKIEKPLSASKNIWFIVELLVAIIMLIVLWVVHRVKRNKESKKDLDVVKQYEDYLISDETLNFFDAIAAGILFLLPYVVWVTFYYGRGTDFCFHYLLPIFIYYIYNYYEVRKTVKDDIETENLNTTDESQPRSIHSSYPVKIKGVKSKNPIILLLDYIFQWYPKEKSTLFLPLATPAVFICSFAIALGVVHGTKISILTIIITGFLIFVAVCALFRLDKLYRRQRHKYIKKHNLPGPYGWGTIDYNRFETYKENKTYNIGGYGGYGHGAGWVSGHYRSGHYRNGHWVSGHWVRSHWRN